MCFSRSALFYMQTRVSLKYFVDDFRLSFFLKIFVSPPLLSITPSFKTFQMPPLTSSCRKPPCCPIPIHSPSFHIINGFKEILNG